MERPEEQYNRVCHKRTELDISLHSLVAPRGPADLCSYFLIIIQGALRRAHRRPPFLCQSFRVARERGAEEEEEEEEGEEEGEEEEEDDDTADY